MSNESNLIPAKPGDKVAKGVTSEKRRIASRLNGIKTGKYASHPDLVNKPRSQLLMEKALLSQGVSADQVNQLAAHVLHNLHRTGELLENELTFATSGQYTKLALDVTKGLRELVPEKKEVSFDAASVAINFLRSKGHDDLAAELSQLFMREQLTTRPSNDGNEGTTAVPVLRPREDAEDGNVQGVHNP